jgi:hypothetical protein
VAVITSATSGNFADGSTWVGGVAPGPGDEARVAATHVVTIAANVTCQDIASLNTSGYFVIEDGVILTANVIGGATTANNGVLLLQSGDEATINGNVEHTQGSNTTRVITVTGESTLNVTGSVTAGVGTNRHAIVMEGNGATLNVGGDVVASTSGDGVRLEGAANVLNIDGNVVTSGSGNPVNVLSANSIIWVGGNVTNGGTGSAITISSATGFSLEVEGNVSGSSASTLGTINAASAGDILVHGDVGASSSPGVRVTSECEVEILGTLTPSSTSPAFQSTDDGTVLTVAGNLLTSASNVQPYHCLRVRLKSGVDVFYEFNTDEDGRVRLVSPDQVEGFPDEEDVRDGIDYGPDDVFQGSLVVPDPQYVLPGVPVDDTVGTAPAATIGGVAEVVGAQLEAALSPIAPEE